MNQPKLTIELVPAGSWRDNLRSKLSTSKWNMIKKAVYEKAGNQCEICGGRGKKWPVECHEIWDHNVAKRLTTLKGLIALCPSCHSVKHIGLAFVQGRGANAVKHLAKVNGWSIDHADRYACKAMLDWQNKMSMGNWTVDASWLDENIDSLLSAEGSAREALRNARRATVLDALRHDSDEAKEKRAERSSALSEAKGIVYGGWS